MSTWGENSLHPLLGVPNNVVEESSIPEGKPEVMVVEPTRPYSDFVVNGVPIWQIENRGKTVEEDQAYNREVERLNKDRNSKSKLDDVVEANLSGHGVMPE